MSQRIRYSRAGLVTTSCGGLHGRRGKFSRPCHAEPRSFVFTKCEALFPRLDELWAECVTVAHFSEAVAKRGLVPFPGAFAAGLLHGIGRFYILVKSASPGTSRLPVPLNSALVDSWHPAIAKAVLQNWRMDEVVCEAVGAQSEAHIGRAGPVTLTDVLIASIRLSTRLQNSTDSASLNAGGAFARLGLTAEVCKSLIAQAGEETRALKRALRP